MAPLPEYGAHTVTVPVYLYNAMAHCYYGGGLRFGEKPPQEETPAQTPEREPESEANIDLEALLRDSLYMEGPRGMTPQGVARRREPRHDEADEG